MRIIFAGTPETAIPALEALSSKHEIIGVFTRKPAPRGRKKILTNSPVHDYALTKGFTVYTPSTLRDDTVEKIITELEPDAVAVVAYGLLIPVNLLNLPRLGWFNLHYSLLPRWRGASPVQAAIAAGDEEIGTCVFQIEEGLDTGPILQMQGFPRNPDLTATEVLQQLSISGAQQIVEVFDDLARNNIEAHAQVGESSYAPLLTTKDAQIDWNRLANCVQNQIHAYNEAPGAWTVLNGVRIKIGAVTLAEDSFESDLPAGSIYLAGKKVNVATKSGAISLNLVSPAGKKWMNAADWLRGVRENNPCFTLPDYCEKTANTANKARNEKK